MTRADAPEEALAAQLALLASGNPAAVLGGHPIDLSTITKDQERCAQVLSGLRTLEVSEADVTAVMPSAALPLLP